MTQRKTIKRHSGSRRVAMEAWHPAVSFAFFAAALVLTVVVQNPAFAVASLGAAVALLVTVRGARAWRTVGALVPLLLVVALVNPLVNTQGATVLLVLPWGRPYTLEALLFGVQTGLMLVTMLLWFASFNRVLTAEKLTYLMGGALPGTSLVLTMVMRLVPRFGRRAQTVALAFAGLDGAASGEGLSRMSRLRRGARELSGLVSWALEGSIDTADSMQARGYGSGQRTRLANYGFDAGQRALVAVGAVLLLGAVAGVACGCASAQFVPVIVLPPADGSFCLTLLSFTLFLVLPALVNVVERLRWRCLLSNI